MSKAAAVPDAWDDDWEAQADSAAQQRDSGAAVEPPLTKAERLTQHAEANRRIWESADSPQAFHFLEANNNVPLTFGFKPQVRVLSRKPVVAKRDPVTGMAQLTVDGGDGDAGKKEAQLSPDEVRAKQKRDREEKQRRYDEARAKIFGESAPSSRGSSRGTVTPPRGTVTPPRSDSRHSSQGRGRGRGGAQRNHFDGRQQPETTRRQGNQAGPPRELYDPNLSPKPDWASQRRAGTDDDSWRSPRPRDDAQQPIRAPRGPDGSGRGGFGFARRGAK